MTNTFITPQVIAARALATLYNTIVLAALVSRDFDSDFTGKQGDTITVRKPAVFSAEEFDRTTGITLQDVVEDSVPLTLDTVANVSFLVTDEQMLLDIADFQTQLLGPASEAIAQKVDQDLANELVAAALASGGGGVVHIGAGVANTVFAKAREKLTRNNLPVQDRYAVLSPESITVALADPLLIQSQQAGSTDALREANIGRLLGIDTYETQTYGAGPGARGQADGVVFHRSAVVLATRPLQAPRGVSSNMVSIASYKGLSLRTVYAYNHKYKQDEVSIDMLYGLAETRKQGAVELDFGQGS